MADPLIVNKCVVCGQAYTSAQSLRAHMKVHRGKYLRTSIVVQKEEWGEFKDLCTKHNSTTCHVVSALIQATLAGEKQGVVTIASPNPILIQVTHNFFGKPRSFFKTEFSNQAPPASSGPRCPDCGSPAILRSQYQNGFKDGYCPKCGAEFCSKPKELG